MGERRRRKRSKRNEEGSGHRGIVDFNLPNFRGNEAGMWTEVDGEGGV